MSKEFWNEKFSNEEYVYGKSPNPFFAEEINNLKTGKILFPAEGEGRNAVYAAKLGWEVDAFDISNKGKEKAEKLALENNVSINYLIKGFSDFEADDNSYDCIVLINSHAMEGKREFHHNKLLKMLKVGGSIILQGFAKAQSELNSGGPKNREMLFSQEELEIDFKTMSKLEITESLVEINAGELHQGLAHIIRLKGIK